MTQLMFNKLRGLAGCIALIGAFLVLGSVDASAQMSAAPNDNPETAIAQYLGVTACGLGTATDIPGGLNAVQAQMIQLRALGPNASAFDQLKVKYFVGVIHDVRDYSIYPEIALLSNLKIATKVIGGNPSVQQFAGLYNSTKALFGMCQ